MVKLGHLCLTHLTPCLSICLGERLCQCFKLVKVKSVSALQGTAKEQTANNFDARDIRDTTGILFY